jgi:superfamily II DNA/RNA helicase
MQMRKVGVEAAAIHGNLTQHARKRALENFTTGHARVLVATDVAARGIHVDDVDLVVHYDPPADHKDYLHRSGRTAAAGASGTVLSLVTSDQVRDHQRHARAGRRRGQRRHRRRPATRPCASWPSPASRSSWPAARAVRPAPAGRAPPYSGGAPRRSGPPSSAGGPRSGGSGRPRPAHSS